MKIGDGPKPPPLPGARTDAAKTDATKTAGKGASTFPDVMKTPSPGGPVPIPYPNVGGDSFERAGSRVPSPLLAGASALSAPSSPPAPAELAREVGGLLRAGEGAAAMQAWVGGVASGGDANLLETLGAVMKEAVASTSEDKRYYLERLQGHDEQAQALSDALESLVEASASLAEMEKGREEAASGPVIAALPRSALQEASDADRFVGLVSGFSSAKQELRELVGQLRENDVRAWEEKLSSIGDDAQLANVDLQNILQKQQQTLQMMSNISKMLYDTAQSVIRKLGG